MRESIPLWEELALMEALELFNKFIRPFLCRIISGENFKFSNSNATVFNTDLVRMNSLLPLVPSVPWVLSLLPLLSTMLESSNPKIIAGNYSVTTPLELIAVPL